MGGGGRWSVTGVDERGHRAPHARPPFTVGQLKKAVPVHCFNRSLLRSFSYLIVDLLVTGVLLCSTALITSTGPLGWISWLLYWIAQGCVLTGVWMVAHDCGHNAFSDYTLLNDTVGLFLHSCLLVPYFSWKISHRRHHGNTGSMSKDEVYVPKTRESLGIMSTLTSTPIGRSLAVVVALTLGWPLYAMFNAWGRPYGRLASHFDPNAPFFNNRERLLVVITDVSLVAVGITLYKMASAYGLVWLLRVYAVPILVVNAFVVIITFLHHTHPSLPHYSDAEWEWLRGALSTVDRDYGILNHVFHHITDTHVAHHIFPMMPHYHAEEATKAIKPILGKYYQFDNTPIAEAFWREFKECLFVEPDSPQQGEQGGIFWYRNKLPSD